MSHFTLDTPMKEIEAQFPFSRVLLQSKFHLGGCQKCGYEPTDSVQEAAEKNSKHALSVLQALNAGLEEMSQCEISCEKVKMVLDAGISKCLVIDVREPWEFQVCHLSKSKLLSEANIHLLMDEARLVDLVVIVCHHGVRSLNASLYFRQQGINETYSMSGGLDRYAKTIDPALQRY